MEQRGGRDRKRSFFGREPTTKKGGVWKQKEAAGQNKMHTTRSEGKKRENRARKKENSKGEDYSGTWQVWKGKKEISGNM